MIEIDYEIFKSLLYFYQLVLKNQALEHNYLDIIPIIMSFDIYIFIYLP